MKQTKGKIIKASPAMLPQLVPLAPRWVNALVCIGLLAIAVVLLPKTPDSLVAIGVGAGALFGTIIDAQLLYSDAQALTVTAVSTNLVDHGADRNLGLGASLAIVVTVDVAMAGTTPTLTIVLQTDDNAAFSSPATVATTAAIAGAALPAGAKVVIPVPPDTIFERFSRLSYTLGGTTPTITVTAFMSPRDMVGAGENVYYADAITIG